MSGRSAHNLKLQCLNIFFTKQLSSLEILSFVITKTRGIINPLGQRT